MAPLQEFVIPEIKGDKPIIPIYLDSSSPMKSQDSLASFLKKVMIFYLLFIY